MGMMVLGVRIRPAPPANPYPTISAWPCATWTEHTHKIRLATSQVVDSLVNTHQRGAAARVDGLTGALEVEKIRDTICHDGDAIPRGAIRRRGLRVSHGDLLVVCALRETRYSSENSGGLTLDKRADKDTGPGALESLHGNSSYRRKSQSPSCELGVLGTCHFQRLRRPLPAGSVAGDQWHLPLSWPHQRTRAPSAADQQRGHGPLFLSRPTFASNAATSSLMKCAPLKLN